MASSRDTDLMCSKRGRFAILHHHYDTSTTTTRALRRLHAPVSAELSPIVLALRDFARHTQQVLAMELQVLPPAQRECADVDSGVVVDPNAVQRHQVRDGRHDEKSRILEGNEPPLEDVTHRRGQGKTVLAVEPLVVTTIARGLDVARDQVPHAHV